MGKDGAREKEPNIAAIVEWAGPCLDIDASPGRSLCRSATTCLSNVCPNPPVQLLPLG